MDLQNTLNTIIEIVILINAFWLLINALKQRIYGMYYEDVSQSLIASGILIFTMCIIKFNILLFLFQTMWIITIIKIMLIIMGVFWTFVNFVRFVIVPDEA